MSETWSYPQESCNPKGKTDKQALLLSLMESDSTEFNQVQAVSFAHCVRSAKLCYPFEGVLFPTCTLERGNIISLGSPQSSTRVEHPRNV